MKHSLKLLTLFTLALTLTYCSKDGNNPGDNDQGNDDQENVALDANIVFNGLIIEGASIVNENSPQPAGNISFSLDNTSTALIKEGFSIEFSSTENIAGAYLIITDVDGNEASSYFDIPETAFDFFAETNPNPTKQLLNKKGNSTKNGGGEGSGITIDFIESLSAGTFCYSLCVYDDSGNISQPQTVCVTIQNYGGNNDLVDYWTLVRYQENDEYDTIDVGLNEEFCYSEDDGIYCDNGTTLSYDDCYVWNEFYMEFWADGTYRYFIKSTYTYPDYKASASSCTIVNISEFYEILSEGNWAYDNNTNKLLMASYFYRYNENGEITEEFLGAGNAEFLFDIPVTVSGNTFVLDFSEPEYQEIYTFQK